MRFSGLTIGIPREIMPGERRVAAIPETVKKMVLNNAAVLVGKGAGEGSFYPDAKYKEAGAVIIDDPAEIYDESNIILKVKEPQYNSKLKMHEADLFHDGQYLVCFLHPASPGSRDVITKLAEYGVNSLTLDCVPKISRAQGMDALASMSTVAGYKAVLLAANRLTKFLPMTGTTAGMIKPSDVVIIGAGVAGLQAISTARRLGSLVTAVDIKPDAVEQARALGARVFDLGIPQEVALDNTGAIRRLSGEWLEKEREKLKEIVRAADILILAVLIPGKESPMLITEEMVKSMQPGSVIIDISADQGGCCTMTEPGKIITRHGVSIDGTRNIPGTLPASSTFMFAHNMYNFLEYISSEGRIALDRNDPVIGPTLTTCNREIVHEGAREAMRMQS